MGYQPFGEEYRREIADKPAYALAGEQSLWLARAGGARGWACGRLASWRGNGSPKRRSVAGLSGRSATLGLRTPQTPTVGTTKECSAPDGRRAKQSYVPHDGLHR